jgi:hypothetical protein
VSGAQASCVCVDRVTAAFLYRVPDFQPLCQRSYRLQADHKVAPSLALVAGNCLRIGASGNFTPGFFHKPDFSEEREATRYLVAAGINNSRD